MTIKIKPWQIILLLVVCAAIAVVFLFKDNINQFFISDSYRTVDSALSYLKNEDPGGIKNAIDLFSNEYVTNLMARYSYYKVDDWKLKKVEDKSGRTLIYVDGTATNAFGATLKRRPVFVMEKVEGKWKITDSYDFFVFDKLDDNNVVGKSDIEKNNLLMGIRQNVIIESWSFQRSYGSSVEGKATIVNNSDLPVTFIKLEITYYDRMDNVSNTDETYAIGGDALRPGQKRNIEWYTSNCYQCNKARVRLNFD